MPATNPRLTITLAPPVSAILRELSGLTGNSQSALVGELLEEAMPVFSRMVRILRAAEEAKRAVKEELVAGMESAQARLEGQLGLALEELDGFEGKLLETVERVGRRGGRDAIAARRPRSPKAAEVGTRRGPPLSNRGVRSPIGGKSQSKTAKKRG